MYPAGMCEKRRGPTSEAMSCRFDVEFQVKKVLPIQEKRDEAVPLHIAPENAFSFESVQVMPVLCGASLVVCLVGETGSGKSTQARCIRRSVIPKISSGESFILPFLKLVQVPQMILEEAGRSVPERGYMATTY